MKAPHVDVRRLLLILLFGVMLPLTIALLLDITLESWPLLTLFCAMIVLPVGTFFMSRAALNEMNKVIEVVAPPDDDEFSADEPLDEDSSGDGEPVGKAADSRVEQSPLN